MKKILFVLIMMGMLLLFSGGFVLGHATSNNETESSAWGKIDWLDKKLTASEDLIVISTDIPKNNTSGVTYQAYEQAYLSLDETEKAAYRKIVSTIQKNKDNEYIDMDDYKVICIVDLSEFKLSEEDVVQVYWSVLSDHVEMFFVKGDFLGYVNEEETFLYVLAAEIDNGELGQKDVYATLNKYEADVIVGVQNVTSPELRIRYVFDYVMNNLTYAEDSKAEPIVNDTTSSLACVVDGYGICSGYAKLFTYLCNCVEIPAIYVTGYANQGYHAWTYVCIDNLWYACDTTFEDYGSQLFLKGKDIYSTHQPLVYGVNTYDFCYSLPELSENDYSLLAEPEKEEEDIMDNMGTEDNLKDENVQDDHKETVPEKNEINEEVDEEIKEEIKEEHQETIDGEKTPVDEEQEEIKENIVPDNNQDSSSGTTVPTNPNRDTWIEIAPELEETQIQLGDDTVTVWEAPPTPKDTVYLIDGEPYMNGMPAYMYYMNEAQESTNNADKIANYTEALNYAPEDEGVYFNLGVCYSNCNDYDNAFYYYIQAIEKGDTTGAVDNIVLLIEGSGQDEAEKELAYKTLLNLLPNDARILSKLNN